jgi:hypothetical protein
MAAAPDVVVEGKQRAQARDVGVNGSRYDGMMTMQQV